MTNLTDALHIPDTQSERDERHLAIQRVGVKDVRYPLQLRVGRRACSPPSRSGTWTWRCRPSRRARTCRASSPGWTRSTSRWTRQRCARAMAQMLDKLRASEGRIEARFPFFLRKRAPVSGVQSLLDYQGRWIAETRAGVTAVWAEVGVPVKSLCPCSKEISDYGAHNQRSHVTIRVELLQPIDWPELVRFAEDAGLQRALADAQARRREVGHRARLREPQVRRGPGARRGAAR